MTRQWMRRRSDSSHVPCPPSHATYGELAEEIQRRIQKAVDEGKTDPMIVHDIADQLTEEGRLALIRSAFDQLDTTKRWELLAGYFDDDTIRRALQQQRDLTAAEADPNAYAQLLATKTRASGRFELDDVKVGMQLVIYLYAISSLPNPANAHKLVKRTSARCLRLTLAQFGPMRWRVLDDTYDANRYSAAEYVPGLHAHVFLGCPTSDPDRLVSLMFYGAPLLSWQDGSIYNFDQKRKGKSSYPTLGVGRCLLNGVEMFHDPANEAPDDGKDNKEQDD